MTLTMRQVLLFTLVLILLSQYVNVGLTQNSEIKAGIIQGNKAVSTLTTSGKLVKETVLKLISKLRSFLSIVGPMVAILSALLSAVISGGESAELKFMKKEFLRVNKRFDKVELQLSDLKKQAEWNSAMGHFMKCETKILTLKKAMDDVFETKHKSIRTVHIASFFRLYDADPSYSLRQFYEGVVGKSALLKKNLFDELVKFSKYHLPEVTKFVKGTLQLLTIGATIELTFHQLRGDNISSQITLNTWKEKLGKVGAQMMVLEKQIKEQCDAQVRIDVDNYVLTHSAELQLSNKELSSHLFHFLTKKYPFRLWFVVVFNDVKSDKYWGYTCGGHVHKECHGYTIITASVLDEFSNSHLIQNVVDPRLDGLENGIMSRPYMLCRAYRTSYEFTKHCIHMVETMNSKSTKKRILDIIDRNCKPWTLCSHEIGLLMKDGGINIIDGICYPYAFVYFIQSDIVELQPHGKHVSYKKFRDTWVIVFG